MLLKSGTIIFCGRLALSGDILNGIRVNTLDCSVLPLYTTTNILYDVRDEDVTYKIGGVPRPRL